MTSQHRPTGLRVAAPTLEPDPVLLGVLAELGASSRPVAPRTPRSAGLRMIVATASVAVMAAATWAAGTPTGADTPLSPADSPTQQEPSGPPSRGHVGTPQPDVSISPGSPLSPGLPGTNSARSDRGAEKGSDRVTMPGRRKGEGRGKGPVKGTDKSQDKRPSSGGKPDTPADKRTSSTTKPFSEVGLAALPSDADGGRQADTSTGKGRGEGTPGDRGPKKVKKAR